MKTKDILMLLAVVATGGLVYWFVTKKPAPVPISTSRVSAGTNTGFAGFYNGLRSAITGNPLPPSSDNTASLISAGAGAFSSLAKAFSPLWTPAPAPAATLSNPAPSLVAFPSLPGNNFADFFASGASNTTDGFSWDTGAP